MIIPRTIRHEIIRHALDGWPNEICGILAGIGQTVERRYPAGSTDPSPAAYDLSVLDHSRIAEEIEEAGLEFLAIYHSHPTVPPVPSTIDVEYGIWPVVYVIVSLEGGDVTMRGWRLNQGEYDAVEVPLTMGEYIYDFSHS